MPLTIQTNPVKKCNMIILSQIGGIARIFVGEIYQIRFFLTRLAKSNELRNTLFHIIIYNYVT